jgi:hypothetical protein
MRRDSLTNPGVVILILILQIVPFLLFPASSFQPTGQEWWLPVLLVIMALVADFQIIVQRTTTLGPWYLIGFAQGFNIISRLMMLFPHATVQAGTATVANWQYIVFTTIAILLSMFMLWYEEKPEVRMAFLPK